MRALLLARKQILEILREPALGLFTVLFPVFFLLLTEVSYGAPLLRTHSLQVIQSTDEGSILVDAFQSERYADGRNVFEVKLIEDVATGMQSLKDRTSTALVEIDHFPPALPRVTVYGDALYGPFYRASVLLDAIIFEQTDSIADRQEIIRIDPVQASPSGARSEFDLYAPGMIVFALLMLIPQTAALLGRELRWGTLRRLRLTRMTALDLYAGIGLSQMLVAILQIVIVFLVALALGYQSQGSLTLAMSVGLVIALSAIGQGLALACFIENDSQAVNLGSSVSMLQVFLSGAFFALPTLTLFTLTGHEIDLFDFVPAKHGMLAFQMVLNDGWGLDQIAFRFFAALLLSMGYFALGVWVFRRKNF
jgi:ABC-2 type transport system permease protein